MTTKRTSPAKRTFRVYATDLLFQDVEAASAKKAYALAEKEQQFEPCGGFLTLDPVVTDLESDEYVRVGGGPSHCKTCGSDLVMMMNDSNFQDGECSDCEYRRYQSQPELLRHLEAMVDMARSVSSNWESGDLAAAVRNLDRVATAADAAIANAHGAAA